MLGLVRRLVRTACVLIVAAVAFAPVLLGPATGAVVGMLGGEVAHKCACGMKPGTCGCPECARLERQRQDDERPRPYPVFKPSCDPGTVLALAGAAPFVLSAAPGGLLPAARVSAPREGNALLLATQITLEPPTPPPRRAST